jgi:hypothetical protein
MRVDVTAANRRAMTGPSSACLRPLTGCACACACACACVPPLTVSVCCISAGQQPAAVCSHMACLSQTDCQCWKTVLQLAWSCSHTSHTLAECLKSCCGSITRHMPHARRRLQELDRMSLSVSVTVVHTLRTGAPMLGVVPHSNRVLALLCFALLWSVQPCVSFYLPPLSLHTDALARG